MRNKWKNLGLLLFLAVLLGLFLTLDLHGQVLNSRALVIDITPTPVVYPACNIIDKIIEDDRELNSIELRVGGDEISYTEERFARNSAGKIVLEKGKPKITTVKKKDFEKEIALKLLNTQTCQTEIIKITKKGRQLIPPLGYEIGVITRPSGILWNAWNTYYEVIYPENRVVIKNVYPLIESTRRITQTVTGKNGKKEKVNKTIPSIVKNIVYVPYSDEIRTTETERKGREEITRIVEAARNLLNERAVYSKAFPTKLVTEILPAEYYHRRPVIEQSDLGEFILDPNGTVDRFLVILGTNGKKAWSETCNNSGACGLYQFTDNGSRGTYRTVVKSFPVAKLIKDFQTGASDQVNSAMSAMLLDDLNLAELKRRYGEKIINDPKLEEYLAAAYNGAPKWVHQSLNATLGKNVVEWGKHLRPETVGFMVKLRYLRDNNLPVPEGNFASAEVAFLLSTFK